MVKAAFGVSDVMDGVMHDGGGDVSRDVGAFGSWGR